MATSPIWQDITCNITHNNLFRVSGGQDELGNTGEFYRGRAISPSGSGTVAVKYNRICRPRMVYGAPPFNARTAASICQPQAFTVEQSSNNGGSWSSVASTNFRPDWSYRTFNNPLKSVPITRAFHPLMTVFYTVVEGSNASVTGSYTTAGGSTGSHTISGMSGSKTASYPIALIGVPNLVRITLGSLTWDKPADCAPAALYYRNPYGGWDAFCIEGNMVEANAPERFTRKVDVSNAAGARAEYNYVSGLVKRWTLHTGGLTDTESARMWLLLTSNDVWLHDFAKDTIVPVILEDGSQDEKTYKNNGRKMVTYTITCRLAQDRITM